MPSEPERHATHLSCETQLGGTCALIGCSQRWLEPDRESNQRARRGATWLKVLDPTRKERKVTSLDVFVMIIV